MRRHTKNILVVGMQGSGKSHLAKKWREMGVSTVDADELEGLGAWYDREGDPAASPIEMDAAWLNDHVYLWDKEFLARYLSEHEPVIILGAARNSMEMLDLFDLTYYLQVPVDVLMQRLRAEDRDNQFGMHEDHLQAVADRVADSDRSMANYPVQILDGGESPEHLLSKIAL